MQIYKCKILKKEYKFMKSEFYQKIYSSISRAIKEDLESYTSQRQLVTQNSRNFLKWDLINTNIKEILNSSNFEAEIVKMGSWRFLLILDKENNTLISLMNTKRYETICSNKVVNAPLYLRALVGLNQQLGVFSPLLFDFQDEDSQFSDLLHELCRPFYNKKYDLCGTNYKIITFTTNQFDEVIGLNLLTLDVNLDLLSKENLFDYLIPEYQNNIEQSSDIDIQQPKLKITKKAEQRIGEKSTLSLKNTEEISSKQA